MSGKTQNLALIFEQVPSGLPKPGEDLVVRDIGFDNDAELPPNSVNVEVQYLSIDPYQRGLLRPADVKSYFGAYPLGKPIGNSGIAKVIKSNSPQFQEGDVIKTVLPFAQYATVEIEKQYGPVEKIDVQTGPEDVRHWLAALGMPGLTAYSSLYAIGKPKKGETIFISSAAGAVGQLVGAISKKDGLKVIGSVGSDEKLKYIIDELGFDGGFNYKSEKASDALQRLAPDGIDIYYDNVGGEQLSAALDASRQFARFIECGMISQYNKKPGEAFGIQNLMQVVGKRITMRGFIVADDNMGPLYAAEHKEKVSEWLKDGSFKATLHEWSGMENAAKAFVGMLQGENFGKAILKAHA